MILSASGGLVYHARAAFMRIARAWKRDAWAATRRSAAACLEKWLTHAKPETLIIFGPSSGYLLPRGFFARIQPSLRLIIVEPDPIAGIMFRIRFASSSVTVHGRTDLLPFHSEAPDDFAKFLTAIRALSGDQSRRTAVLFFGVLGQMDLHKENFRRDREDAQQILLKTLRDLNFPWASLHDLESTTLRKPLHSYDLFARDFTRYLAEEGLSARDQYARLEAAATALERQNHGAAEWTDHETAWLSEPQEVIPWPLARRRLHLLGWTESKE